MNASQGQTLKKVGVWLVESQCFAHGQLYVAASRTGSPSDLHFATTESGALQDSLARNVVYREVLLQKHPDPGPSALSSSPCHLPTVDIPDNHGEQDYRGIDDEGESSPEVNLSAPLPPGVKEAEISDKKLTEVRVRGKSITTLSGHGGYREPARCP